MNNERIVADGQQRSTEANQLRDHLAKAEAGVRSRFQSDLEAARGFRRLFMRLKILREISRAKQQVREDFSPDGAFYLQP